MQKILQTRQTVQHVGLAGAHSRGRSRRSGVRAAANGDPGGMDWRAFRARLIERERGVPSSLAAVGSCTASQQLLALQSPALAVEGAWAHSTAGPVAGDLLLAAPAAVGLMGVDYWQAVVLLLQHSKLGSLGLVLNRPTNARVAQGADGLPTSLHGKHDGPPNSRLYWGGSYAEHVVTLLHGGAQQLPGSREVAPGLHVVFGQQAVVQVAAGDLVQPGGLPLRFFAGAVTWGPGQLEDQVAAGAWGTAAVSRSLVLKHCLQLPVPLWREISGLLDDGAVASR